MSLDKIKKIFSFPPPTFFGASNDHALEIEDFKNSEQSYTWEKYRKDLKSKFPLKYFILKEVPDFIKYNIYWPIKWPVKDFLYFIKCHIFPSKRYHYLSLKQPKTNTDDDYTYGWIDADKQILFACMNILVSYVEKERGLESFKEYINYLKEEGIKYTLLTEEEKKYSYDYHDAYERHKKILDIYFWWTSERKVSLKEYSDTLNEWSELRKINKEDSDIKFKKLHDLEKSLQEKEQQMLIALVEARQSMWT